MVSQNKKLLIETNKTIYSGNGTHIEDLPDWLPNAEFSRSYADLILKNSDYKINFIDYFINFELPSLQTKSGLRFEGKLVESLAGRVSPYQYSQSQESVILSIGEVSNVNSIVKATRLDGTIIELSKGDPVFQGDVIETVDNGSVGLTFVDKTTLSLSDGGKMVLDELIYDSDSGTGSMAFDMVKGAFSFVSGEIAKTGPDAMSVSTPVVTCGIRGTSVAGKAAVEGSENSFTLLQDLDGGVGQISISNAGGTQILGQVGATTVVSSFNIAPPTPIILSATEIQSAYGSALNILPPTPAVAPQQQEAEPEEENEIEDELQDESEDENSEDPSEEATEDSEIEEESSSEEIDEPSDTLDESEESINEEDVRSSELNLSDEEIQDSSLDMPTNSEESATGQDIFETALAEGESPAEAMVQAVEESQNVSQSITNQPQIILSALTSSQVIVSPSPLSQNNIFEPISLGSIQSEFLVPVFNTIIENYAGETINPGSFFFDDPSLYDYNQESSQENNQFYIDGINDFGRTISNYSLSDTLTINFDFDAPSTKYSVTRSNFYEYNSTSTNLQWDSNPSSTSQTVTETEDNGTFGSAQLINRSSFKITTNNNVGDDSIPWVNIENGYISNGVDLFKLDLQIGETLVIDIDFGDSFGQNFNSFVTLYNSSQISVGSNDDSAATIGGSGSSGSLDSYLSYTATSSETFYIFVEDAPGDSNSSTTGDYEVNLSITPTSSSTGLGTSSSSGVGGNYKVPYLINFTENTDNYLSKSFKSDLVSSIKYTDASNGTGSEVFLITGNGTSSAIWLWDDLSEGYGISDNELTFVAKLENFNNDTLTGTEIAFGTL